MLSLSKKGDYGLLLVTALAAVGGKYISLKKLASDKKLPYKFLSAIAGQLHEKGILESKEGIGGGYRLAKSSKKILVRDILDVLEGPMQVSDCDREEKCECGGVCVHETVEAKMVKGANRALAMFTVADLISD